MTLVIPQSGCLQCRRPRFNSWVGKILWRRDRLPTPVFLGFLCGSAGKESTCNPADLGLIPGLRRSPGEGNSYLLQYSGQENSRDCIVHGVLKNQTRLSDFHFLSFMEHLQCARDCEQDGLFSEEITLCWRWGVEETSSK